MASARSPMRAPLCGATLTLEGGDEMALTRKDALATVFTLLAVLVFAAAHESWNVPLVGSSLRWAAAAILLLGVVTCSLGAAGDEMSKGARMSTQTKFLATVGAAALVLAIWAIAAGSLTALTLLTVCFGVLWAGSTLRHVWQPTHGPRRRLVT